MAQAKPEASQPDADKAQNEYQQRVDKAVAALKPTGLDIVGQLNLIMADGSRVPIRGIVADPVVVEQNEEPKDAPAGADADSGKTVPEKAQQ